MSIISEADGMLALAANPKLYMLPLHEFIVVDQWACQCLHATTALH